MVRTMFPTILHGDTSPLLATGIADSSLVADGYPSR
jgi:hypothetical protein